MTNFKLVIWILLLSTLSYAQTFRANTDTYSFPLSTDKPLNVQVTIKTQKSFCMSRFEFFTNDKKLILKNEFMMNKEKVVLNAPVAKGDYLLVYSGTSGCANKHFDISITKTLGNFEQELNDDMVSATPMQELTYYYGYIQKYKDEDYYKITIDKKSDVSFVFEHKNIQGYGSYTIDILNDKSEKITTFKSSLSSLKNINKKTLDAGTYFIKVSAPYSSVIYHRYKLAYSLSK
jgi:hypothetical protein